MIHIASHAVTVNTEAGAIVRQRCIWCGVLLVSQNLAHVAVQIRDTDECASPGCGVIRVEHPTTLLLPDEHDFVESPYPTWPANALVFQEGGVAYVVQEVEGQSLKDYDQPCCALLDPEVTA